MSRQITPIGDGEKGKDANGKIVRIKMPRLDLKRIFRREMDKRYRIKEQP